LLAGLIDPDAIAFEGIRDRACAEFDPAHRCRRQKRALLDAQLSNVVFDDGDYI